MLKQFIKGKVYIFIDAANLLYVQRTLGWKIAYEKLIKYFKKECDEKTKCFVYIGTLSWNAKQKKFLDLLDILGYIVRTKPVKKIKVTKSEYRWKCNFDIEIAVEMLKTIKSYDTAVLVSGDSDFASTLDALKLKKKNVIVMCTRGHVAKELLDRAKYIDIRKLKKELTFK